MQIVLIQAEIEKAIRNYVNSIVKVAEGVDIVIDLKSTRGDTGFTANIDLVETGVERAAAPAPKAAAAKANTESSDDLAAAAAEQAALKKKQEQARDVASVAVAVAKQATTDEPGEGITEPPFEPDVKEETQATTTAEPEASEQPAAPRKPLFGRTNAALNA